LVLVEAPSRLETEIGVARRAVTGAGRDVHARVQGVVSRWIGIEHAVESASNLPINVPTSHTDRLVYSDRIKSIITPTEPLTPGILYVGIATLTGSIITRSRGLTARLLFPPAFLLGSMEYFFPQTSANVGAYIWSLERAHVPSVAEQHGAFSEWMRNGWRGVREGLGVGREKVDVGMEGLVRRVQDATGLKLSESFRSDSVGLAVRRRTEERRATVDEKADTSSK
jgi:organizing structure protein 2